MEVQVAWWYLLPCVCDPPRSHSIRRRSFPRGRATGERDRVSERALCLTCVSVRPPRLGSQSPVSTRPPGISNTIAAPTVYLLTLQRTSYHPPTHTSHTHSPIMVLAFSGLSLAKYVTSSPALMRVLKPVADAYARAAGYRKMGLRYDDLLIEENGTAQKVSSCNEYRVPQMIACDVKAED